MIFILFAPIIPVLPVWRCFGIGQRTWNRVCPKIPNIKKKIEPALVVDRLHDLENHSSCLSMWLLELLDETSHSGRTLERSTTLLAVNCAATICNLLNQEHMLPVITEEALDQAREEFQHPHVAVRQMMKKAKIFDHYIMAVLAGSTQHFEAKGLREEVLFIRKTAFITLRAIEIRMNENLRYN